MSESEYRFTRNKEKTAQLQDQLFRELEIDRTDPNTEGITRVIYQHFIVDDNNTGTTLHLMNDYNTSSGGLCVVPGDNFNHIKNTVLEIARDRGYSLRFYYRASLFEIDLNGKTTRVP